MKRITLYTLISIFVLFILSLPCFAEESSPAMVYASGEELQYVFDSTQKEDSEFYKLLGYDGLSVVKETISPVYTIDLFEYSRTNEMTVVPLYSGEKNEDKVYIAKMIDKKSEYAGFIQFYVKGGIAYRMFSLEYPFDYRNSSIQASPSYADHAERIRKCLNADSLISPYDVKYLCLDGLGDFFYIKNQNYDRLIAVGVVSDKDGTNSADVITDYSLDRAELKQIADSQREQRDKMLAEKEAWEKEHPGETWVMIGGGYGTSYASGVCSEVDNIQNVAEYLDIDYSLSRAVDYKTELSEKADGKNTLLIITVSISVLIVSAAVLLTVFIRRKKQK